MIMACNNKEKRAAMSTLKKENLGGSAVFQYFKNKFPALPFYSSRAPARAEEDVDEDSPYPIRLVEFRPAWHLHALLRFRGYAYICEPLPIPKSMGVTLPALVDGNHVFHGARALEHVRDLSLVPRPEQKQEKGAKEVAKTEDAGASRGRETPVRSDRDLAASLSPAPTSVSRRLTMSPSPSSPDPSGNQLEDYRVFVYVTQPPSVWSSPSSPSSSSPSPPLPPRRYDPSQSAADFEALVREIYSVYNPDKLQEVHNVIKLFEPGNRQQVLLDKLCRKYDITEEHWVQARAAMRREVMHAVGCKDVPAPDPVSKGLSGLTEGMTICWLDQELGALLRSVKRADDGEELREIMLAHGPHTPDSWHRLFAEELKRSLLADDAHLPAWDPSQDSLQALKRRLLGNLGAVEATLFQNNGTLCPSKTFRTPSMVDVDKDLRVRRESEVDAVLFGHLCNIVTSKSTRGWLEQTFPQCKAFVESICRDYFSIPTMPPSLDAGGCGADLSRDRKRRRIVDWRRGTQALLSNNFVAYHESVATENPAYRSTDVAAGGEQLEIKVMSLAYLMRQTNRHSSASKERKRQDFVAKHAGSLAGESLWQAVEEDRQELFNWVQSVEVEWRPALPLPSLLSAYWGLGDDEREGAPLGTFRMSLPGAVFLAGAASMFVGYAVVALSKGGKK